MRRSVFVVEDDIATRTLLTVLLNRTGLEVDAIGRGTDTVTLLSAVSYSAVLFDLQLPGASGHDILAHLEANDPETIAHSLCRRARRRLSTACVRVTRRHRSPVFRANHSFALAAIPLIHDGKVFGAAGWSFRDPRPFSEQERQQFEAIATILASELHQGN